MNAKILDKPKYNNPVEAGFEESYKGRPTVACVWVSGPANYTIEHVLALKRMVDRHLQAEYDFVCLTDHTDAYAELFAAGIKPIIAKPDVPGWWQKTKLFSHDLWKTSDRVLYLDLDVVIVGSLDDMFGAAWHTVAIANFGVNYQHSKYNSSVVCFNGRGPTGKVWTKFVETGPQTVMKALHGDQCWLWRVMLDTVKVWPRAWVQSYKYEARRTETLHPDAKIIVYHGDPKPWDTNDNISKEYG